mmetsp:Transcript_48747/g.122639  ORF Transcript_48747/g.122639 Transcript_48747/m.122639 type:complete len:284 (-) Transcript_48747:2545-3396(-)
MHAVRLVQLSPHAKVERLTDGHQQVVGGLTQRDVATAQVQERHVEQRTAHVRRSEGLAGLGLAGSRQLEAILAGLDLLDDLLKVGRAQHQRTLAVPVVLDGELDLIAGVVDLVQLRDVDQIVQVCLRAQHRIGLLADHLQQIGGEAQSHLLFVVLRGEAVHRREGGHHVLLHAQRAGRQADAALGDELGEAGRSGEHEAFGQLAGHEAADHTLGVLLEPVVRVHKVDALQVLGGERREELGDARHDRQADLILGTEQRGVDHQVPRLVEVVLQHLEAVVDHQL